MLNFKIAVNSFDYFNYFMDLSFDDFVTTTVVTTPIAISIKHFAIAKLKDFIATLEQGFMET